MAALRAGFVVDGIDECSPDEHFAELFPRAGKYVGWPMLVVLQVRVPR
jgi:malonyl-CoA O-methyltransferase